MNKPLVSILIVTYNSQNDISECLQSVLKSDYSQIEIIIVDNNSTDSTVEVIQKIKDKGNRLNLIKLEQNIGYAKANNLAASKALGEYLFIVNPDTFLDKQTIKLLAKNLDNQQEIAAVQPAVFLKEQPDKLNLTGKVSHYLGFDWIRDYQATTLPSEGEICSLSGCAFMIRKKIFDQLEGFDASFFMYYEDTDFSWRLLLQDHYLWFQPKAKLWHDYHLVPVQKSNWNLKTKLFYLERNRLMMLLKNYQWRTLLLIFPMVVLVEVGVLVMAISQGWIKEKILGYSWLWKERKKIFSHRRQVQLMKVISDKELLEKFSPDLKIPFLSDKILNVINLFFTSYWKVVKFLII